VREKRNADTRVEDAHFNVGKPAVWQKGAAVTHAEDAVTLHPALQAAQRAFAQVAIILGYLLVGAASILLVGMSAVLFLQVLYRYVLQLPLPWSEEAARFCLVWFAMLASCVAGQQGVHFSLRWAVNWLAPGPREIVRMMMLSFGILVLSFVSWKALLYLSVVNDLVATATLVNMFWVYLAIPVGCGSLALNQFLELNDAVAGLVTHMHF
jgi:TRAP-type C4-dicarboxylate transport system permease small subunit